MFPTSYGDLTLCILKMACKYYECTLLERLNRYRLGDTDIIFMPPKRVGYREVLVLLLFVYETIRYRNDVIFGMTSSNVSGIPQ